MKSDCSGQKGQRFLYRGSSVKDSGYNIQTQTWMIKKKKKKQLFKRLYKRASQVQGLLVRSRAGIQSPPLWIQTSVVLTTPSCLLNVSLALLQLSLISWSSLKSSVTSSGADMSPCLIQPVLPNDSWNFAHSLWYTRISSAFSSPITM